MGKGLDLGAGPPRKILCCFPLQGILVLVIVCSCAERN